MLQINITLSIHFQPNLQSYNAPTIYPLELPNNQLTLQNANNVSSNNSKLDQKKKIF